ncbi:EamA family transporter [Francisella sp. 19X1-34]|uniref:EamA family transporter n=1 Tax=Francisella sp. 19X1-34 TaxID=3087177 RepID=UPI002E2EAB20|nr:EamA family transporter [Francisella sp. 19X1-34]MED7789408.1 EamA family transporter [Francisella sp. 19X1-34]
MHRAYFGLSSIMVLPFMLITWHGISLINLSYLIFIGVGTYLSQYCFMQACRFAHSGILAPIAYTAIIFSAIFDWLFWQTLPHWYTWIGCILVIIAGIMNVWLSHRH